MKYAKLAVATVQALLAIWLLSAPSGPSAAPRRTVARAARSLQRADRDAPCELVAAAFRITSEVAMDNNADADDDRDLFAWLHAGELATFGLGTLLPSLTFEASASPPFVDPRPVYRLCHRQIC